MPRIDQALVIAEVAHLLGRGIGTRAELLLAQDFAEGLFTVESVHHGDPMRIAELTARYAGFLLRLVDASVIACAARLGVREVATVDRRHFGAVRPAHTEAFTLLP
ncbi:PIN domain-containing protein [Streptomyces sp. NPDC026092]|uniref:PIN domain-containing protein n=1 Tax=Streptomyces sp. NPDC026092 TaxID=3154797 RepID=UPI0033F10C08